MGVTVQRSVGPKRVRDVFRWLGVDWALTDRSNKFLKWPPDVFAVAALLLAESGAYVRVVTRYSSESSRLGESCKAWSDDIVRAADQWNKKGDGNEVEDVRSAWEIVTSGVRVEISALGAYEAKLWPALVQLMAICDQACAGVGIPRVPQAGTPRDRQPYKIQGTLQLLEQTRERDKGGISGESDKGTALSRAIPNASTLCRQIDPSRAIVLPKMRTPQRGITIRSLSHHLALFTGTNTVPAWIAVDPPALEAKKPDASRSPSMTKQRAHNILVLPFPHEIHPAQFAALETHVPTRARFSSGHDFFAFRHDPADPGLYGRIDTLVRRSEKLVGPICGLVMPEMAMTREAFETTFRNEIPASLKFMVCGLYEPANVQKLASNYALVRLCRSEDDNIRRAIDYRQDKHHRWALDEPQIRNYGLSSSLHPGKVWWEGIHIPPRELQFFLLDNYCVFSVLICEDLARPDPIGDLIRAVGPNLVIALLQDGPQLADRWASRYATALADDPGCSVLTVTSLGMSKLSRPQRDPKENHDLSRVVALWRDPWTGTRPLTLLPGTDALILSLTEHRGNEVTADGRDDNQNAGQIKLGGVLAVNWNGEPKWS